MVSMNHPLLFRLSFKFLRRKWLAKFGFCGGPDCEWNCRMVGRCLALGHISARRTGPHQAKIRDTPRPECSADLNISTNLFLGFLFNTFNKQQFAFCTHPSHEACLVVKLSLYANVGVDLASSSCSGNELSLTYCCALRRLYLTFTRILWHETHSEPEHIGVYHSEHSRNFFKKFKFVRFAYFQQKWSQQFKSIWLEISVSKWPHSSYMEVGERWERFFLKRQFSRAMNNESQLLRGSRTHRATRALTEI